MKTIKGIPLFINTKTITITILALILSSIILSFVINPSVNNWKRYILLLTSLVILGYSMYNFSVKIFLSSTNKIPFNNILLPLIFYAILTFMSMSTFLFSQEADCVYTDEEKEDIHKSITIYSSIIGVAISSLLLLFILYTKATDNKNLTKRQSKIRRFERSAMTI